ncbi:hypothetical protein CEXT_220041 [Caerostris extrusa]|uniref:Uncharacterized protein n=1 Tax=Caerostris extrusa TaxID=172846 RepID=A0AAV4NE13_CAEEX|nr:hypothetical protein CEXT_220041 [Caerostris extrusa]
MGLTLKRTVIHPRDVISGPPPHWLRSLCSRFTLRSRPRQRFPWVAASRQVRRQVQIHSCSQLGQSFLIMDTIRNIWRKGQKG